MITLYEGRLYMTVAYCFCKLAACELNMASPFPALFSATSNANKNKPKLTIPTIVNYGGFIQPMGPLCTVGIQVAMDRVQSAGFLTDYSVQLRAYDDKCDQSLGTNLVLRLLNSIRENTSTDPLLENLVPFTLGPICPYQIYFGRALKHYSFTTVSFTGPDSKLLHDRIGYNSFFSLTPTPEIQFEAAAAFVYSNGWRKVFLLTETIAFWDEFEQLLLKHLAKLGVILGGVSKVVTREGQLAPPEMYDRAVDEMARFDPRVIIVDSMFGSMVACSLHRRGLHGPKFVFILHGTALFLPSAFLRSDNCTNQMLTEILDSSFLFYNAYSIDLEPNTPDSTATTGRYLLDKFAAEIDHPESADTWHLWKALCYEQTMAGLLAVNAINEELKSTGDSLLNWTTSSRNFQENGTFIHSLMLRSLEIFRYDGQCSTKRLGLNSLTGPTAFYQVKFRAKGLPAAVDLIPIAKYDSSHLNPKIVNLGQPQWKSPDHLPPNDSTLVIEIKEPVIANVSLGILTAVSTVLLLLNGSIFALMQWRIKKSRQLYGSLYQLNSPLLIANMLLLTAVLVLIWHKNNVQCMISSAIFVPGACLVLSAIQAKMEIAKAKVTLNRRRKLRLASKRRSRLGVVRKRPNASAVSTASAANKDCRFAGTRSNFDIGRNRTVTMWFCYSLILPTIHLAIVAVWFGIEPLSFKQFNRRMDAERSDISLVYQHVTSSCRIPDRSVLANGFIIALVAFPIIIILRSLLLAFQLRKCQTGHISDLQLIRIAAYSTSIITVAGSLIVLLFFNGDPGILQIGIAVVAIVVVSNVTAVVFAPKFRHMV